MGISTARLALDLGCAHVRRDLPWRCPACREVIRHSEIEEQPRPNAVYRCVVCRLELQLDPATGLLVVVPLADTTPPDDRDRPKHQSLSRSVHAGDAKCPASCVALRVDTTDV
jgi:hypothetical protein